MKNGMFIIFEPKSDITVIKYCKVNLRFNLKLLVTKFDRASSFRSGQSGASSSMKMGKIGSVPLKILRQLDPKLKNLGKNYFTYFCKIASKVFGD